MERIPEPRRTRRGEGVGAKVALAIDYYRPPDGAGPDYGALSGRDGDGPWELHFASPEELEKRVGEIVEKLRDAATRAREATADGRGAGLAVWLKTIGAV